MINTSNEYDNRIAENRAFALNANITLADDTLLELDDAEIMQGGMEFEDATSGTSSFQIGAAIINKHTLTIDNKTGRFDKYDFTGATVVPFVGLQLSKTVESLRKGFYTVDEPNVAGNLIVLECLDNMHKLERAFSEVILTFPTTAGNALQVICTHCGISLATTTFTNSNYTIQSRPDGALSCLDMVSYIAQIAGCFARCNIDGALELKWYDMTAFESEDNVTGGTFDRDTPYSSGDNVDGGNFTDYNSSDSVDGGTFLNLKKFWHLYDFGSTPTVAVDDVVITGIKIENTDSENQFSSFYGLSGYVLSIVDNPLMQSQSDADQIANSVGVKIVGMKFRPFSVSCLSNPAIESGDPVKLSVRSRDGFNVYLSYITNLSYKVGSREAIQNNAETPSRNSSTRYSAQTKTYVKARNIVKQQLTAYDIAVQQLNSVMTNAMGYYPVREEQPDGSYIDYMCDKPTLAESKIIWKKSINGFAVSDDGGQTWTSGFTADGNIIAKTLSVIGINAEWIKVLTSFTVGTQFSVDAVGKLVANNAEISGKVTASEGQIGPFRIGASGLFSNIMEFFEDNDYPLIWLTKKGANGEPWGSKADGTERANYESAVCVARAVEDGIETDVFVQARDDSTGLKGQFTIRRSDVNTGQTIEAVTINPRDGLSIEKWNGGAMESLITLQDQLFLINKGNTSFSLFVDDTDETVYMSSNKININGHEF